jgi:hypothetical protein
MLAADILTSIAEISVALLGFTGIIAAFRQPAIATWPPHIAYRFRFMCWNAFSSMSFALVPFLIYNSPNASGLTWQIASSAYALVGLLIVWRTAVGAKKLPPESRRKLSAGWMLTYQTGTSAMALLLFTNSFSVFSASGPFLYLLALGMQLFIASSLFVRLLITPTPSTE